MACGATSEKDNSSSKNDNLNVDNKEALADGSTFEEVLALFKTVSIPHKDEANHLDTRFEEATKLTADQLTTLQMSKRFSADDFAIYTFAPNYQVDYSKDFKILCVIGYDGENLTNGWLISYSKDNEFMDMVEVLSLEMAEGYDQTDHEIQQDTIKVIDTFQNDEKSEKNMTDYVLTEDGEFHQVVK